MVLRRGQQSAQAGFVYDSIIVEQQKIVGLALVERQPQSQVVSGRKSQVVIGLEQAYTGAFAPYPFDTVILRAVVYHPHGRL